MMSSIESSALEINTVRRQKRKADSVRMTGLQIALEGRVERLSKNRYQVKSNRDTAPFLVDWNRKSWSCSCLKSESAVCEHIYAISFVKNLDSLSCRSKEEIQCPQCNSPPSLHVRRGKRNNRYGIAQAYSCKVCGYRFVHRPGFEKMQSNPTAIVAALDLRFKGLSLSKISSHLKEFYNVEVTPVTVHNWVKKYIRLIKQYTMHLQPNVSSKWHADETQLKVNGKQAYLWNMMDSETRFLIAKILSYNRRTEEAQQLLEQALNRVGKEPKELVTDGLKSYDAALNHEKSNGMMKSTNHTLSSLQQARNNRVERMHGTFRERTKTLRGLDNIESAGSFTDGLEVYYNYIRPHSALEGKTPAVAAGVLHPDQSNWRTLIRNASKDKKTD
jgi:transposase-like protein